MLKSLPRYDPCLTGVAPEVLDLLPVPLVGGPGSVRDAGRQVRALDLGDKCLLVTDRGIVDAGHADRVAGSLQESGIDVLLYDRVRENPTADDVNLCLEQAARFKAEFFIGLGGGSSMDTAKGCNFLLTNGGTIHDYWGQEKAEHPLLPFVAIPTTAGTGSECQRFALISDPVTHRKMACGDHKALAALVILDPELTLTQPPRVAASSGIDALSHAIESSVSTAANPKSRRLSREAFRLLSQSLHPVLGGSSDIHLRAQAQMGAALAGAAIEFSMLGAAHAAANPLTARLGMIHGQAVGLMLPEIVRFNGHCNQTASIYRDLLVSAGQAPASCSDREAPRMLAEWLADLTLSAGLGWTSDLVGDQDLDPASMADDACEQWTARFNPRKVKHLDFHHFYLAVLRNGTPRSQGRGTAAHHERNEP